MLVLPAKGGMVANCCSRILPACRSWKGWRKDVLCAAARGAQMPRPGQASCRTLPERGRAAERKSRAGGALLSVLFRPGKAGAESGGDGRRREKRTALPGGEKLRRREYPLSAALVAPVWGRRFFPRRRALVMRAFRRREKRLCKRAVLCGKGLVGRGKGSFFYVVQRRSCGQGRRPHGRDEKGGPGAALRCEKRCFSRR